MPRTKWRFDVWRDDLSDPENQIVGMTVEEDVAFGLPTLAILLQSCAGEFILPWK
jgi:hypothetical protein